MEHFRSAFLGSTSASLFESPREVSSLEEGVLGSYPFAFQTHVPTDEPCGRVQHDEDGPYNLFELGCDADVLRGIELKNAKLHEKWALLLDRRPLVFGTGDATVSIHVLASCMGRHRICIALQEGSNMEITASHVCLHSNLTIQDWERGPISQVFTDRTVIYRDGEVCILDANQQEIKQIE